MHKLSAGMPQTFVVCRTFIHSVRFQSLVSLRFLRAREEGVPLFCFVHFALLCFALLQICFVSLCFVFLCFALLCFALLCLALFCFAFALLCSVAALPCFALFCFAASNSIVPEDQKFETWADIHAPSI